MLRIAGPYSPTVEVNDASIGSLAWEGSIGSGALEADGAFTTAQSFSGSAITNYLKVTGFPFTLPGDAVIRAIVPRLRRQDGFTSGQLFDHAVRIVKGGNIGSADNSSPAAWPNDLDYINYNGGLWEETWNAADINSPDFGWALSLRTDAPFFQGLVDHMPMMVIYEELEDLGESIFEQCINAILTIIQGLPLSGINPLNWKARKFPWNRPTMIQAGGYISPLGDKWTPVTNQSDDVEYPVQVTWVRPSNNDLEINLGQHLLWREQIRKALLPSPTNQPLAGMVPTVYDVRVEPGPVFDPGAFQNQYDVGAVIVRCISREPRLAT